MMIKLPGVSVLGLFLLLSTHALAVPSRCGPVMAGFYEKSPGYAHYYETLESAHLSGKPVKLYYNEKYRDGKLEDRMIFEGYVVGFEEHGGDPVAKLRSVDSDYQELIPVRRFGRLTILEGKKDFSSREEFLETLKQVQLRAADIASIHLFLGRNTSSLLNRGILEISRILEVHKDGSEPFMIVELTSENYQPSSLTYQRLEAIGHDEGRRRFTLPFRSIENSIFIESLR